MLDAKIPEGPLHLKWQNYKDTMNRESANKRKFKIIVVRIRACGASAAATLGELGYKVEVFTFHDSPRALIVLQHKVN